MDEKKFEQEYRKIKQQAAPELWNRIDGKLVDHPERETITVQVEAAEKTEKTEKIEKTGKNTRRIFAWHPVYGVAAAAAVVIVAVFADRQAERSMDFQMQEETMAAYQAAPELAEAGAAENVQEPAVSGVAGIQEKMGGQGTVGGVLRYEDLSLAAYQPLTVPQKAVTVPEDSEYFSEAILGDTGLLCGGTVTDVSLETDGSGTAVKVVYKISVDQVYYAEDYTTGMESITVKSPIVETEGDEAFVLYQLQKEGTYLLPLENKDGGWELLYPFAPQIQVTGDGAYLFHSGYTSLADSDASVVIGRQEGDSDYYYDRMLLRKDDNFLSDLISLVERETQGRKQS